MACCGGGGTVAVEQMRSMAPALADVPDGMVLVEYIGGNVGSETWGGKGGAPSGRFYTFGANERDAIKYVDIADVDWFLSRKQNTLSMFKLYEAPQEPTEPEAPTLPTNVDPGTLTVAEIKELDLTLEQWIEVFDMEQAGKNRTGALDFIVEKIEALKNAE